MCNLKTPEGMTKPLSSYQSGLDNTTVLGKRSVVEYTVGGESAF